MSRLCIFAHIIVMLNGYKIFFIPGTFYKPKFTKLLSSQGSRLSETFQMFRRNTFQLKRLQPTMLLREKRFDPDMFHNFNSLMDQAIHISPQAQCLQILSAGFIPSKSFNLRLPVFEIIFLPGNEVKNNLICDEYL